MVEEGKQISLTLPRRWVEFIDSKTTKIKSRQDLLREWIEPHIKLDG